MIARELYDIYDVSDIYDIYDLYFMIILYSCRTYLNSHREINTNVSTFITQPCVYLFVHVFYFDATIWHIFVYEYVLDQVILGYTNNSLYNRIMQK